MDTLQQAPEDRFFSPKAYDRLGNDALLDVYAETQDALERHLPSFPLTIPPSDMNAVLRAALDDNPRIHWFEGTWKLDRSGYEPLVRPQYNCDGQTASARTAQLNTVVSELVAGLKHRDSLSRIKTLYEWMLANVRYGMGNSRGQTAYDALVGREALCKGMSKALQLLLTECGIPAALASGSIHGFGRHVWNIVLFDTDWLNVDVSLPRSEFDYLFEPDQWDNPFRCCLVPDDRLRSYGVCKDPRIGE